MRGHLIDSTEMYLRTVLELEEEGIPALRARLSERLELSAPSVSEAVAKLESEGLVHLAEDRTVQLTAEGRDIAVHVMRKHRLAERLLVDVIGLEPEHAHEEACRWEHVISDRVESKLLAFLGNPQTSPYGNPIPEADAGAGAVPGPGVGITVLAEADDGARVRIERFSERLQGDQDAMHAFDAGGVRAGAVVEVDREDGRLEVVSDDGRVSVDEESARLVYVSLAS